MAPPCLVLSRFPLIHQNSPAPPSPSLALSKTVAAAFAVAVAMEAPRRTDSSGTSSGTSNDFPHREPMIPVRSAFSALPPLDFFFPFFSSPPPPSPPFVLRRPLLFCFGCSSCTEISRRGCGFSPEFEPFRDEIRAAGFRFWCWFEFDQWLAGFLRMRRRYCRGGLRSCSIQALAVAKRPLLDLCSASGSR